MFIAAAINDQLLYLIAAAAYGVFAWWNNRRNKNAEPQDGQAESGEEESRPIQRTSPPAAAESEQERLRRFLEALGVPAGQQAPPPKPAQQQPVPPRPIAPPPPRPVQHQRPPVRPIVRPVRPSPRPLPEVNEMESIESRDPGRLEESATAIERVGADLDQMSLDVRAMSAMSQAPSVSPGAAGALFTATQARTMIEIFRSPETLRTALLAQEILGPPRSLQS
jgi:hypothetical protein